MRGFLILYMTKALGFTDPHAGAVYGNYVGGWWRAPIFGGFTAARWLGHSRSVLIGGIIIALGHFTLAFHALPFFYAGLSLIVIGTGLLKPNVSTLVGSLYEQGDERRDAGFSIFYMGINLGAFLGPLIAGKLAEAVDWHLGFACAGVGMSLGLVQYVLGRRRLDPAIARLAARPTPAAAAVLARKVRPRAAVRGTRLRAAHAGGGDRPRRRQDQSPMARRGLFHRGARRAMPQPRRPVGRDQTCAEAGGRAHDGGVLPL